MKLTLRAVLRSATVPAASALFGLATVVPAQAVVNVPMPSAPRIWTTEGQGGQGRLRRRQELLEDLRPPAPDPDRSHIRVRIDHNDYYFWHCNMREKNNPYTPDR